MKNEKEWLKLIAKNIDECYTLFQAILDAIPYALIGFQNRQIIFTNKSVKSIFGWKNTELIGKSSRILFTSDKDYEKIGENIYPILEKKPIYKYEWTLKRKDGKNIVCLINISRIGSKLTNKAIIIMIEDITEKKQILEKLKQTSLKYQKTAESLIHLPGNLLAIRDSYTAGHEENVAKIAKYIAEKMNLSREKIKSIYIAGILHDIGKILIPLDILAKPSKLNKEEWALIKKHPSFTSQIFKNIYLPWDILDIILQHHERLNGSGYPNGLKKKDIDIGAKIIAVADVIDAMTSFRPYRPALGMNKAIEEISTNKGKLYDPNSVDAFIKIVSDSGPDFFMKK